MEALPAGCAVMPFLRRAEITLPMVKGSVGRGYKGM